MYELIIIGGGPAGMTAAISAGRSTGPTAWRTTWAISLSKAMS